MARALRRCAASSCEQHLPSTASRRAKYCSAVCRQRAYRQREARHLLSWRLAAPDRCDFCDQVMPPIRWTDGRAVRLVRDDASFCSDRCRQRLYRVRRDIRQLREDLGIEGKRPS